MARRIVRARRRGAPLRARRWTANLNSTNLTVATQTDTELVSIADYLQSSTLEPSGVTLARIRGNISFGLESIAADGDIFWGIAVCDEDEGLGAVNLASTAIGKDMLAWGSIALSSATAAQVQPVQIPIDIKAMRKLKRDKVFCSAICTGAGNVIRFVYSLRALLIGG